MTADQLVGLGLIVAGILTPLAHRITTTRRKPPMIARTIATLALVAATALAGASTSQAYPGVKGPQHPPTCGRPRCPVKVAPSPGPFVVKPARPAIPRTTR